MPMSPSSGAYGADPVFDRDAFGRLRRDVGDGEAHDLLRMLTEEEIPQRLGGFERMLAAGDHAGAARELHSLSGPAGLLGCMRLARLASELEQALRGLAQAQAGGTPLSEAALELEAAQRALVAACGEAVDAVEAAIRADGAGRG